MESVMAELPLALFTTLASIGAGAFIALTLAFFKLDLDDSQLKRIDRLSWIAFAVLIVGFIASAFHVTTPAHAVYAFNGLGHSPLSNEIAVGGLFVVVALIYLIIACSGKLSAGARKGFSAVVSILAVVFALFMGTAYMMDTISSWNVALLPFEMLGFMLAGGTALGVFVLAKAGALEGENGKAFEKPCLVLLCIGVLLALVTFIAHIALVSTMRNAAVSGAALVGNVLPLAIVGAVLLVVAAVCLVIAAKKGKLVAGSCVATILFFVGILLCRLAFYGIELSVGLAL